MDGLSSFGTHMPRGSEMEKALKIRKVDLEKLPPGLSDSLLIFYLPGTEHGAFNVMKTQEIFVEIKKKEFEHVPYICCVALGHTLNLLHFSSDLFFLICKMMIFELHGLLNSAKF